MSAAVKKHLEIVKVMNRAATPDGSWEELPDGAAALGLVIDPYYPMATDKKPLVKLVLL